MQINRTELGWRALLIFLPFLVSHPSLAQDNYEIQVYSSETVAKHNTMVELHSNFTFNGQTETVNGVLPTQHMLHETIEITHGFTSNFEVGFYLFSAIGSDNRTAFVGSHIRPRVSVPKSWNWPVGASLSAEFGYQKPAYSEDDWTLEIRPIVDKQIQNLYLSFNPTFDKSFQGVNKNLGFVFSPDFKIGYNISKSVAPGIEYYGSIGPFNGIPPVQQQQHQIFAVVDLDFSPNWEFNAGYGWGLTESTDGGIFKLILGYRFH
jgi:hypothetical protein